MSAAFSADTSTGCGTQQLLRYRSHLVGRGPNNSSLFLPLAAVTVVAGHSIARPIACGNRVPPYRTVLGETTDPLADAYPLVCTQYSPMLWPGWFVTSSLR